MKTRYRLVVVLLLFMAGMINYMDRAAIGLLATHVRDALSLSPSRLGLVFSAFFFGYAIFSFIGGYLSDRIGPKKTFALAALAWSIFCGLTGVVTTYGQLIIVRMFFGAAEGPMSSTTNRMITNWFPRAETSRALGFALSGQFFGSAVAAPIVIFSAMWLGWRMAFAVLAVFGLAWCLAWVLLVKDQPAQSRFVSPEEAEHIVADRRGAATADEKELPVTALMKRPSTIAIGAALFSMNYTLYIFVSWLPSYLISVLHLSASQVATAAPFPWVGGLVGSLGGGVVCDFFYRRATDKLACRRWTSIIPMTIAGAALLLLLTMPSVTVTLVLFFFALLCASMALQSIWSMIHEVIPANRMGGVGGFVHLIANTSGIISPAVMGYAVQYFGGYSAGFTLAAAVAFGGALGVLLLVRRPGTPRSVSGYVDARPVA